MLPLNLVDLDYEKKISNNLFVKVKKKTPLMLFSV